MTLFYDDRSYTVPYGYVANVYAINSDNKLEIVRQYEAGTDFYKVPQEEAVVLTYADENNPAGTSIIYFDEPFDDYNAFIVETSGYESNLRGSNYGDTYDVWGRFYDFESKYYKLALGADGKAGFYWGAPDGGPFTLPEHRCFLAIPRDDAPAKIALDDTTTGITATESTDNDDNAPVYNIAGQRVNNAYKGLVIKNGKKTIVK